jgi:hypothetical protein
MKKEWPEEFKFSFFDPPAPPPVLDCDPLFL